MMLPWQPRLWGRTNPTPLITSSPPLLLLLLLLTCSVGAEHPSQLPAVLDGVPDIRHGPSSGTGSTSSFLSSVADRRQRSTESARRPPASLLRRDASSARGRPGRLGQHRPSIVFRRAVRTGDDGAATAATSSPLARLLVVNYARPSAGPGAACPNSAGDQPWTARVNPSAVITSLRQPRRRRGRGGRLLLSTPRRPRSVIFGAFTGLFARPEIDVSPPVVVRADQYLSDVTRQRITSALNGTHLPKSARSRGTNDGFYPIKTSEKTDFAKVVRIFSDTGLTEPNAGRESVESRAPRRSRRQIGNESSPADGRRSNSSETIINGTMAEEEESTTHSDEVEVEPMEVLPSGAVSLRYRSRGNFAALVDPVKGGRARSSVSSNLWLQPATNNFSSTVSAVSPSSGFIPDPTSTLAARQDSTDHETFVAADSIEVEVLRTGSNDSTDEANSTSAALIDVAISKLLNTSGLESNSSGVETTTAAAPGEWNCSVELIRNLGAGHSLRKLMSPSAAAICVYSLSFLFALVATFAVTSLVLSVCLRPYPGRCSSPLVLGFVALATAARALYFVTAEYQLATVAPPGCRAAIYECFFVLLLAAYVTHHYRVNARPETDELALAGSHRVKRSSCHIKFCRDVCLFVAGLCVCLAPVLSVVVLIQLCIAPVEAVFILRSTFALLALLLSAANVYKISKTYFGCSLAAQVILCAVFVIHSGFSVFDAATLLSNDLALHRRQNAKVWTAVEVAGRTLELIIPAMFCLHHSSMFSGLACFGRRKKLNSERSEIPQTKTSDRTSVTVTESAPTTWQSLMTMILGCTSKKNKSKVVDSTPFQTAMTSASHAVGWPSKEDDADVVDPPASLPAPWKPRRSRSMLYNDQGFIRFRLDGDTDGESDARTLDDDEGGPGQSRSAPASEYASADDLSSRRGGPSSAGTPRWSRSGTPSFSGFRAPSIHLQDSIDRALDCCDIWRVGCDQGQLSVDELQRIVQLYADVSRDGGRVSRSGARRRADEIWATNCAEV